MGYESTRKGRSAMAGQSSGNKAAAAARQGRAAMKAGRPSDGGQTRLMAERRQQGTMAGRRPGRATTAASAAGRRQGQQQRRQQGATGGRRPGRSALEGMATKL